MSRLLIFTVLGLNCMLFGTNYYLPSSSVSGDTLCTNEMQRVIGISYFKKVTLRGGDTVFFEPGEHMWVDNQPDPHPSFRVSYLEHSGADGNPIVLTAKDGPGTVLIKSEDITRTLFLVWASNITFENLGFKGADHNIYAETRGNDTIRNITIRNCTFEGFTRHDFIKGQIVDNMIIERCIFNPDKIDSTVNDQWIDMLGVWGGFIRDNIFYGRGKSTRHIQVKGHSKDVIIERNTIYNGGVVYLGGSTGPEWFRGDPLGPECENLTFRNNVLDGNNLELPRAFSCKIYNNTIIGSRWTVIAWFDCSKDGGHAFFNNLFINCGRYEVGGGAVDTGNTGGNNMFYNCSGTRPGWLTNNQVQGNPLLTDITNNDFYSRDYKISAQTSSACNAGVSLDFNTDMTGGPRPLDGGWDIGAHEYGNVVNIGNINKSQVWNIKPEITVWPNPFTNNISISLHGYLIRDKQQTISVYNTQGKLVWSKPSTVSSVAATTMDWDGSDNYGTPVSAGTYIIKIGYGIRNINKQITVVR
ncbi:MAG: FlgD immunoglobulin-like domain containing protein [bacterium]